MVPVELRQLEAWVAGERLQGDPETRFEGVSIDTRQLKAGQLFVAIRGPVYDAHDFLAAALAAGAGALLIERGRALPPETDEELGVVAVDDTTRALGALAAGHRQGFDGPVVAVTGSNGKTTVKEMCAAILSVQAPCLKNRGNLNNEFGLPLTLLEREPRHRALVVEIGMNHRGEIAPLTAIADPTVGVITNVGSAHIEHLGSREEIAMEKGDLIAGLEADRVAVLNADDPWVMDQAHRTRARVVRFGLDPAADVRAEDVRCLEGEGFGFELVAHGERETVQVEGLGEPTIPNALAAAAAAMAAGASLDQVRTGLGQFRPASGRMERIRLADGILLINDSYNANPQSMEAALRSLQALKGPGRVLAVLGDMGELGDAAKTAHRTTGRLAAEIGVDRLFLLGERAGQTADGAVAAGMEARRVHLGRNHEELAAAVREELQPGDRVLIKGSRSMTMERVVDVLTRGREA